MDSASFGKIHVYTGDGKGKTTAAFGLAMRAAGRGFSVLVIQFLKKGPGFGEAASAATLPGIEVEQFGTGRFIHGGEISEDDRRQARKGFERARDTVQSHEADLIVLDELNVAIHLELISLGEVLELIDSKPEDLELIITGRHAAPEIIERADYVTEMMERKHPSQAGEDARLGIEY